MFFKQLLHLLNLLLMKSQRRELKNGTMLPNMLIIRLKTSRLKYMEICISIKILLFLILLQLNLLQNGITALKSCRELKRYLQKLWRGMYDCEIS